MSSAAGASPQPPSLLRTGARGRRAPRGPSGRRDQRLLLGLYGTAAVLGLLEVVALGTYKIAYKHDGWVNYWQWPGYWLDYRAGFVRRGLPGQVLSWLAGGSATAGEAQAMGVVLDVLGAVSMAVVVRRVAVLTAPGPRRWAVVAVLLTSPLTLSMVAADLGRYDTIAVAALALLSWLPWRTRRLLSAVAAGGVLAVAAASLEFSWLLLAAPGAGAAGRPGHG